MPAFRNFSGGEIAPSLYARTDLAKYMSSVRQLRNFVAQKHGGASMRGGTEYLSNTKGNGRGRMIPFIISDTATDAYAVEIGNHYLRFHQNGAQMRTGPVGTWSNGQAFGDGNVVMHGGNYYHCRATHTGDPGNQPGQGGAWQTYWNVLEEDIIELYTPYTVDDLAAIRVSSDGPSMCFVHSSYPPHELRRVSKGPPDQWSFQPIAFGSVFNRPQSLAAGAGTAGNTTYWAVTAVNDITGEEGLPAIVGTLTNTPTVGNPTDLSWTAVPGATKYNIYRSHDNLTYGLIGVASAGAPANNFSDSAWAVSGATVTTTVTDEWVPSFDTASNPLAIAVASDRSVDGKYTITGSAYVQSTGAGDGGEAIGRVRAFYSRNGETRVDAGIIFTTDAVQGDGVVGPSGFTTTITIPDNGYTSLTIYLVPEVIGRVSGEFTCVVSGTTVAWTRNSLHFSDAAGTSDNTQAPPTDPGYFGAENEFPSAVTHYQQRRVYGNSNNNTGRVWASRIGNPNNFLRQRPLTANAPVVFDLAGHQTINIRHLLDIERLVAFTSGQEKFIDGEVQTGILRPDAINARATSYNGIGNLPPIPVGDMALYVQGRGNQVRLIKYGAQSTGADLTVMASHLFKGRTLVSWDFALNPDSVIWAVRSDGALLGLTFLSDSDMWGWHRHDTQGEFESVCVIPEGTEDRVYLIVKRIINGEEKRFVERMATQVVKGVTDIRDAIYMDAAKLLFDGRNTNAENWVTLSVLPSEVVVTEGGVDVPVETDDPGGPDDVYTEGSVTQTLVSVIAQQPGTFTLSDVGRTLLLVLTDGQRLHINITAWAGDAEVQGYAEETLPDSFVGVAIVDWARTVDAAGGLRHLVGEAVSVLADGYVMSSPNNPEYPTMRVGVSGALSFQNKFSVIRAGLPFIADIETLDIDIPAATIKATKRTIARVVVFFENSADIYVGQANQPTDENPTLNLQWFKLRDTEDYNDPTALVTDDRDISPYVEHNTNGRVFLRQLDPLPTTILMIAPNFGDS